MGHVSRRTLLGSMGMLAGSATIAACGSSASSGPTEIRYGHWDNGDAQTIYSELLQQFMDENEGIAVADEFASYDDFQERMTTQIAGKDVADIFWVASPQVLTYAENGLYRNIEDIPGFNTSHYDDDILERIKIDGTLNTMPMGMSIPAIRWNSTYAEEDQVEFPLNSTWDELAEFLIDYSNEASEGRKGIFYQPDADLSFEAWIRQHGEDLWTEDKKLGATVDTIAAWLDWWEKLRNNGATLTLDEQDGISPSWNDHGAKVLAAPVNHNHILEASAVFPECEFSQSLVPVTPDATPGHAFGYMVRLAVYAETQDDKLEAIGKLLEFNLNSPEWIEKLGPVMGSPLSIPQREEVSKNDDRNVQQVVAVADEMLEQESRPRFDAPAGTSTWRLDFQRAAEDVAMGSKRVTDAAQEFHDAITAAIG